MPERKARYDVLNERRGPAMGLFVMNMIFNRVGREALCDANPDHTVGIYNDDQGATYYSAETTLMMISQANGKTNLNAEERALVEAVDTLRMMAISQCVDHRGEVGTRLQPIQLP
jgi:hypothetical protein